MERRDDGKLKNKKSEKERKKKVCIRAEKVQEGSEGSYRHTVK